MKNKKNLLIYPKNINFEFLGLEFMRLHKHGQESFQDQGVLIQ